jgi:hypothetical protein
MARPDLDPEERDTTPLQVTQIVTCPVCGEEWDHVFTAPDGVFEAEDLTDPIVAAVKCSKGHVFEVEYTGWLHHEDAG